MSDFAYESLRRVTYGEDRATFIPVCPTCGRFVTADDHVYLNGLEELVKGANATCKKCGRVEMPFEGFV